MNKPLPIPLQLDPGRRSIPFVRAVIASGLSALDKRTTPSEYARRAWNDRIAGLSFPASLLLGVALVLSGHMFWPRHYRVARYLR